MKERTQTLKDQGMTTVEYQILRKDGVVIDDHDPEAILKFKLAGAGLEAALDFAGYG